MPLLFPSLELLLQFLCAELGAGQCWHSSSVPAGHTIPDPGQEPLAFLATRAHCWLMSSLLSISAPRSLSAWLCPATLSTAWSNAGVVVAKVQDPAPGLVKPHLVGFGPWIQPVRSLCRGLQQINALSQLGVNTIP